MTTLVIKDMPLADELDPSTMAAVRGGKPKYGSPAFPIPAEMMERPSFDIWDNGPSIDDAANAGDDSHYYGLRPLR